MTDLVAGEGSPDGQSGHSKLPSMEGVSSVNWPLLLSSQDASMAGESAILPSSSKIDNDCSSVSSGVVQHL